LTIMMSVLVSVHLFTWFRKNIVASREHYLTGERV